MISRRDVLKISSLSPLLLMRPEISVQGDQPNVLVIVFDTFTARNMSLYGYQRHTTPEIARFAEKATVYHQHYAGGNYTSPGTAALLTGVYPWSHRSLQLYGTVVPPYDQQNLFSAFPGHYRAAFSRNPLATVLLHQLSKNIEEFHLHTEALLLDSEFFDEIFRRDYYLAGKAERDILKPYGQEPTSLFFELFFTSIKNRLQKENAEKLKEEYPLGLNQNGSIQFVLEDTITWMMGQITALPRPFLGYYHLLPPHSPYSPRREFWGRFQDGWVPPSRPRHPLSFSRDDEQLRRFRVNYDNYAANVDAEFGRLMRFLEAEGYLENTWVVMTSDHGEMFERGIWGHLTATLFEPILRIPLLIHAPGQTIRQDVDTPTSAVDVLPTLMHVTGQGFPAWTEGMVLPPFNRDYDYDRAVFSMEAKTNPKHGPLERYTAAMVRGKQKLIYYRGYPQIDDEYELYDLAVDSGEEQDVSSSGREYTAAADLMAEELKAKLAEKNKPYQ